MAAHERADSPGVNPLDSGQVDDQVPMSFGDSPLDRTFEFFGWAAFDQRFEGRQDEARSRCFPMGTG